MAAGETLAVVIPGRASWREPGIHNHERMLLRRLVVGTYL